MSGETARRLRPSREEDLINAIKANLSELRKQLKDEQDECALTKRLLEKARRDVERGRELVEEASLKAVADGDAWAIVAQGWLRATEPYSQG
jgi:FixJ family two-component response regulator